MRRRRGSDVRCSSFDPLLAELVDGTLPPLQRARLLEHLDSCERCAGLLEELRVVDALLLTPRLIEPAANFTFRTMAEVHAVAPPHVARASTVGVVIAYLAFAWTIIGAWLLLGGKNARAGLTAPGESFLHDGGLNGLTEATSRLFGHATFGVTALMAGIVAVDIVACILLAAGYVAARPRIARRLARMTETI